MDFYTKLRLFLGESIQCNSTKIFQKYSLNTSLLREKNSRWIEFELPVRKDGKKIKGIGEKGNTLDYPLLFLAAYFRFR